MAMGYPIRNRNEDILQVFPKALPRCTACIRGVRRLTVQAHGTQNGLCAGCAQWGMTADASLANGAPIASRQINVDAAFVQKYQVIRLFFPSRIRASLYVPSAHRGRSCSDADMLFFLTRYPIAPTTPLSVWMLAFSTSLLRSYARVKYGVSKQQ